MAVRKRRFTLAVVALPVLFLAMAGLARANTILVNTLDGGSETVPGPCSLTDAVAAANAGGTVNNCVAGSGANTITFSVTGTINLGGQLEITTSSPLAINGPSVGGITLSALITNGIVAGNLGTTFTLTNLTLINSGGAVFTKGISLTIENCTFFNNQANDGGAVFASNATVTITNSTFVDNVATTDGGAIETFQDATMLLTNDTFVGNEAMEGGALYTNSLGTTDVKGSIFADSTGNNCAGIPITASYSIADDGSCFTNGTNGNVVESSTSAVGLDPLGLQNNGGPTRTIALEPNSPARGLDTDCTDQEATPQPVLTDQRLFSRPNSPSECDSGAYEYDGVAPIVVSASGERLQIVHSSNPAGNQLNTSFTFTENAAPTCDAGDDPFNGVSVTIKPGSCASSGPDSIEFNLDSWVVHTVNHQTYGTLSFMEPPETLSVRMVELPTPAAPACGEWTINLEFAGIDLTPFGDGPFALIVSNPDGDADCFDITNAVVGNQIDPPTRTVRRGVRR